MELDKVELVLRPRSNWEAVDLGLALLQRWPRRVWLAWCFSVLPVCALVLVAFRGSVGAGLIALALLWWLKPLFERVPLFVLSRAVFGAVPELQDVLRELPRLWFTRVPLALVVHRLHPARAMVQPVAQLERSAWGARWSREGLIGRDGGGVALAVALACLICELVLTAGLVLLAWFVTPAELLPDWSTIGDGGLTGADLGWFAWVVRGAWLAAYSITGPLNAAAGFALYMNRRMHLEGWDIELVFRRLAARVERIVVGALVVLLAVTTFLAPVHAQASVPTSAPVLEQRDPAAVAEEVLAHEDFQQTETVKRLNFGRTSSGEGRALPAFLALLAELALWALVVVIVAFLVIAIARAAGWIRWSQPSAPPATLAPTHLFGLDLRPESLPEDVAAEALALWRRGEAAAALGLLYRAAISRLIEQDGLELERSDTESDCVRRTRRLADRARADYFALVTRAWQACAYSAQRPSDEQVEGLCRDWKAHFERRVAA